MGPPGRQTTGSPPSPRKRKESAVPSGAEKIGIPDPDTAEAAQATLRHAGTAGRCSPTRATRRLPSPLPREISLQGRQPVLSRAPLDLRRRTATLDQRQQPLVLLDGGRRPPR